MLAYRHGFLKSLWTAELKGGAIEALNDKPGLSWFVSLGAAKYVET